MADKTVIPLSTGVGLANTASTNVSNSLLDSNQSTYAITTGAAPHLLFVRAKKAEVGAPWVFTLESQQISKIRVYDPDSEDYDPPRLVDIQGSVIRPGIESLDDVPQIPAIAEFEDPRKQPDSYARAGLQGLQITDSVFTVTGSPHPGNVAINIKPTLTITTVEEIGTYILPIAYHSTIGGQVNLTQVARSDLSFWPIPRITNWGYSMQITEFKANAEAPTPPVTPPP